MTIIKGHFWIVRDGKIIDPHFKEYDDIKKFWNCEGRPQYRLESKEVRRKVKNQFIKEKKKILKLIVDNPDKTDWETLCDTGVVFGRCAWNVIYEQYLRGGQIAYGDMGWRIKNSNEIHYEFEHNYEGPTFYS